ncbi:MAG: ATP-binding cassette domain-containing protein [Acidimicrobiales bacterium]
MNRIFVLPLWHFQVPVTVVILGIITGLTYAVLGIGLSLVYRTSRVLNFAQGDMGAFPALFVPILVINFHWNYWVTIALALTASLAIGALIEFLVIRRLRSASRLTVLVATVGVSQLLLLAGLYLPKGHAALTGKSYPTPFNLTITLGRLILGPGQILILIVVPALTLGLTVFLRRSRIGRASRAAAENADAAALAGVPIHRVALVMWALAGLLAGLSAILVGPTRPIEVGQSLGPDLMLRALGAAMLGGLLSLPLVFVGGIAIGIIEALALWNYPQGGALEVLIFIVILVSLLLKKGLGQLARGAEESSWSLAGRLRPLAPAVARLPSVRRARLLTMAVVLVAAVSLPAGLSASQMFNVTSVVVFALIGLSLVVLTGYAGQVSLGQFAFVAIGAALGGRLHQLGVPFGIALIAASIAGGVIAVVVGLPALRIRGLFLAVTTLGFSIAVAAWLFNQPWINHTHRGSTSLSIPRPRLGGLNFNSETHYYWLCLTVLVAGAAAVRVLRRSTLGRAMIACRDNEAAASSLAISPRVVKLSAFVVAGMIASLAGCLYGGLIVSFSYNPSQTFGPDQSLRVVIMVVLGGVTTISGAVLGAIWVQGIPAVWGQNFGILTSGLGLIAILLAAPGGLASVVFEIRDRAARWLVRGAATLEPGPGVPARPGPPPTPVGERVGAPSISADEVVVRYGGVIALNKVSIHAAPGEIVGLMGTNGAGKTTLFDVLSGRLKPYAGVVRFEDREITSWSPHRRARVGFGRTFQQARLFDGLTLQEAVTLAHERARRPDGSGSRRADPRVGEILDMLGLTRHAHHFAGELSTGSRRLGELACVTALGSRLLLLDEPTAGFVPAEVEEFCQALRVLRVHLGATVIVIDHDVPMMARLVDRLYVLEAGVVLAEGAPSILEEDERVVAAYLGGKPSVDLAATSTATAGEEV